MTTAELCRSELNRYLLRMTGEAGKIELTAGEDPSLFEEHYIIDIKNGEGKITANRPRALLLGVYDFLRRCGCRFLRPGEKGELIPKKQLKDITVQADVKPANRHRGITIEGAVSLKNVLDIVEWSPKVGFNSYFLQFRTAYEFFDRWYSHARNNEIPPEPFTGEDSAEFVCKIVEAIKERDMIYHAVGHGWTAACLGLEGSNGWKITQAPLTVQQQNALALVNGKREFFGGIPLNTHLCYSSSEVRERMVEEVVSYAEIHPEIDILHFWLADNFNNVCECENCGKRRLSDWYVMMLNEIDRRFTEKGIKTKICFLVYLDLYWPPETERIHNEERFLMMFAPIFRSYTKPYGAKEPLIPLEYVKNKIDYPNTAGTYTHFLNEWKKIFQGDCFDFDYHLMWDINRDFGGETLAEVLYQDIRSLHGLGMNGFLSCQLQRAFYPSGFAFYLMGRALFDEKTDFSSLREEYYEAAFGRDAEYAKEFYRTLENYVPFSYMKEEENGQSALPKLVAAQQYLKEFLKQPRRRGQDEVRDESLAILRFTAENVRRLTDVLVLKLQGASESEIRAADEERKKFFNKNELRFQPYADGFYVNMIVDGLIESEKTGIYA